MMKPAALLLVLLWPLTTAPTQPPTGNWVMHKIEYRIEWHLTPLGRWYRIEKYGFESDAPCVACRRY